jgi:hypothetical protein
MPFVIYFYMWSFFILSTRSADCILIGHDTSTADIPIHCPSPIALRDRVVCRVVVSIFVRLFRNPGFPRKGVGVGAACGWAAIFCRAGWRVVESPVHRSLE